jgi:AcrR family transcriptional regulator
MSGPRGVQAAVPDADWRRYEPQELTPILRAALDAFYEHGFHGTTVRDIARRVGQTVPSLYYHHDSKEGAFIALLEMSTGELAWRVRAAAAEGAGRPEVQFASVVEAIVLHMTHRTELATLDLELRHLSPPSRKRYAARRKEIEVLVNDIVDAGARSGVFTVTDPHETARAVLGMLQAVARWYQPGGPLTPADLAERYVQIALSTVGAANPALT